MNSANANVLVDGLQRFRQVMRERGITLPLRRRISVHVMPTPQREIYVGGNDVKTKNTAA
jgi:hypothetical protein